MSQTAHVVDRTGWLPGPWDSEPDRAEWSHAGLPCLAVRNHMGNWCGYAAVPPPHPLYLQPYGDEPANALSVHGGLTYSNRCHGSICHVPAPGEPDDVWWFGFDCGHAFDYTPSMSRFYRSNGLPFERPYDHAVAEASSEPFTERYRTLDYVREETSKLAEQLSQWRPDGEDRR